MTTTTALRAILQDLLDNQSDIVNLANQGLVECDIVDGVITSITGALKGGLNGKCTLVLSAGDLCLLPHDGNTMVDGNDNLLSIPASGVTLSSAGAVANTNYYIYASATNGVIDSLIKSTTGSSVAANGVKHLTGDESKILVGLVGANVNGQWADNEKERLVLSYFNRKSKVGKNVFTANREIATPQSNYIEINQEIRVSFLTWGDEVVDASAVGAFWNVAFAGDIFGAIGFDGTTPEDGLAMSIASNSGSFYEQMSAKSSKVLAEGRHYVTLLGRIGTGSGSNGKWLGAINPPQRCVLNVNIKG